MSTSATGWCCCAAGSWGLGGAARRLIIKFLDAMAAALIVKALGRKTYSYVVGGLAGEAIMVAGYFVYEALALQLGMGAAAGVLANVGQGAVGLVIALVLMALLKGSKALDKLAVQW